MLAANAKGKVGLPQRQSDDSRKAHQLRVGDLSDLISACMRMKRNEILLNHKETKHTTNVLSILAKRMSNYGNLITVEGWQPQHYILFHLYYLCTTFSLFLDSSLSRICNSLNAFYLQNLQCFKCLFSLPLFPRYSLLFLVYCTCLVV